MIFNMVGKGGGGSLLISDTLDANGGTIRTITATKVVKLQTKTITPTSSAQTVNPDTGYNGFSQVTVEASSSSTINNQNKTVTPTESQQSITADSGYTGLGTVTVNAISSSYVGSGITRRDSTDLSTSGATITAPAGYYASQATKTVSNAVLEGTVISDTPTMDIQTVQGITTVYSNYNNYGSITPATTAGWISTSDSINCIVQVNGNFTLTNITFPTSTAVSATSGYTSKATVSRSTSDQYINIPAGYNAAGVYYKINAVANGTATGPSSLSGTSATVSTGTNTLTLTKTGVTTTPTVSAGYVSSATASTATVTLTASVTTKAAATYHPSTTAQSISSGTYLTGAQTIAAVTTSNLSASNIVSGVTIKVGDSSDDDCVASVTGNVVLQNYYTGSSAPSSSTGSNGDLYLQS